jgi:hypothetical protein
MSAHEKRLKVLVAVGLVVFVVFDLPPFRAWVAERGGLAAANQDFWARVSHDHLYQETVIQLTGLATLIFVWMVADSRRRRHPWRAWLWLPVYLLAPTIGSCGYLLTRGDEAPSRESVGRLAADKRRISPGLTSDPTQG